MDYFEIILTIVIAPIITVGLTYLFTIRGRKKEIDLDKKKELNTVLSNLILVWDHLILIQSLVLFFSKEEDGLITKEFLVYLLLKKKQFKDSCFEELDESINRLKAYDPVCFYRMEGIGQKSKIMQQEFILPFLQDSKLTPEMIKMGAEYPTESLITEIEEDMKYLAEQIDPSSKKKIGTIVSKRSESVKKRFADMDNETKEVLKEIILRNIPEDQEKPSESELLEYMKSKELSDYLRLQFSAIQNDVFNQYLAELGENPNLTLEELSDRMQKHINDRK